MSGDPPFVIAIQELIDGLRLWHQHDPDYWRDSAEEQLLFQLESAMTKYRDDTSWRKHIYDDTGRTGPI